MTNMNEAFFKEKNTSLASISVGDLQLPLEYHDAEAMATFLPIPVDGIAPLLPGPGWEPLLIRPKIALLGLAFLEFKKTSIGAYNLAAVFTPCLWKPRRNIPLLPFYFPNWFRNLAAHVYQMPVTMEFAAVACSEIWGVPPFLAEIDFEEYDLYRVCKISHKNEPVLRFSLQKPPMQRFQRRTYPVFTRKNDWVLRTNALTQGLMGSVKQALAVEIQFGKHPLGKRLEALHPGQAFRSYYYPKLQGMLNWPSQAYPLQENPR